MNIVKNFTTSKGKECIGYNGYKYRRPKVSKKQNLLTWYCCYTICNATLITNPTLENPIEKGEHTHLADKDKIESSFMVDSMRALAFTETTPLPQIYREESAKLSARTEGHVPALPFVSIHTSLYNRLHLMYPKLSTSVHEIVVPQTLATTASGESFCIFKNNKKGILIFGTRNSLDILCDAEEIFMDGTFYVVPTLYKQLFSIHVFVSGKQVPLLYCLFVSKSRSIYVKLFRAIRDAANLRNRVWNPKVHKTIILTG